MCSNSPTFALRSIPSLPPLWQDARLCGGGPIQSIEVGSGRFRYRLTMPTIKHDGPREIEDERNPGASGPCGARNRGCLLYLQLRRVYGSRARSRNIRTKPMPSWLACAKSTVSLQLRIGQSGERRRLLLYMTCP